MGGLHYLLSNFTGAAKKQGYFTVKRTVYGCRA